MPASVVKAFASKTGKSVGQVEKIWQMAKERAADEGRSEDYAYITGIVKKALKLEGESLFIDLLWLTEVLTEATEKEVELFVGRFQPLHKGHAAVIGKMKNPVVAIVKGKASSADKEKNPLSAKDQAKLIRKAYPKAVVIEVNTGYIPDIALELVKKGMKVTGIWGGEDRRGNYTGQLKSYDKKNPDAPLNIEFKPTFEGGQRIGGTSATLVRKAIRDGDEKAFKQHMPKALHSEWNFLRKKLT